MYIYLSHVVEYNSEVLVLCFSMLIFCFFIFLYVQDAYLKKVYIEYLHTASSVVRYAMPLWSAIINFISLLY